MNVVLGNVGAAGMQVYGQVDRQMLHKKLQQYVEDSGLVRSPPGGIKISGHQYSYSYDRNTDTVTITDIQ
jgi:hypothetical protein